MFLLLQFCNYGQLLELKLLAFLSGTLHILLFISAYCATVPILSVFPALIVHSELKSVHPGFPVAFIF